VAVLATLLTSALSSAKRKARQTASISNLRQIALAFNLYQDDHRKRPFTYASLVREKYLTDRALICAEDKLTGNWAGLIEEANTGTLNVSRPPVIDKSNEAVAPLEIAHSYFKAFDSTDEVWERIENSPLAGIAACQLHGVGRQSLDTLPSLSAYQGLVLRALKDTSVVSRQVFWQSIDASGDKSAPGQGPVSSLVPPATVEAAQSDLPLFLDETQ